MTDSIQAVDKTKVHRALANPRRQHALYLLSKSDSSMELAEIAIGVASRELDESDEDADGEYTEQVLISLHHNHIPKLEDMGIVEYNETEKTASLSDSEESRLIQNQLIQTQ